MMGPASEWMKRALDLVRAQLSRVSPLPAVGAVVVRDGQVVGQAATAATPGFHAERRALALAGDAARGADLYVTLEPCDHQGATPPCTGAVLEAGIARVFVAVRDPNPLARGGVETLRAAGGKVLAVEADKTIVIDQPAVMDYARRHRICLVALEGQQLNSVLEAA